MMSKKSLIITISVVLLLAVGWLISHLDAVNQSNSLVTASTHIERDSHHISNLPSSSTASLLPLSAAAPSSVIANSHPTQDATSAPIVVAKSVIRPVIYDILQKKFVDNNAQQASMLGAAILQTYLNNPNPTTAATLLRSYDCSVISLNQEDQNFIKALTFDTPERMQQLQAGLKSLPVVASTKIEIVNGKAISPCQSIPSAIMVN